MLAIAAEAAELRQIWAPIVMVAGVVGLGILLTFSIRGKIARRNLERPSPRQRIEQLKARRPREHAQTQAAELVELARRLASQLDNKTVHLERLIRQADERIALLSGKPGKHKPAPSEPRAEQAATPPPPPDPLRKRVYELADAGRNPIEIAQELDEQVGKVELILALRAA